jgi:YVTN family beta-propeller protein
MQATRRELLKLAGGLTGAALLTACGAGPGRRADDGPPDLLFLDTKDGLGVLDARRRQPAVAASPAVAGADWTRLYVGRPDGDGTRLVTLDAATGQEIKSVSLPGALAARVVSPSGRAVALTEPVAPGQSPYQPVGRARTTIVVADPIGAQTTRRVELEGNYEPEAFSADDNALFVLQYLPAMAPERYRVRVCDLYTGAVGPLLSRLKTPVPAQAEEEMRGEGRQAVLAPDRSKLFTLYTHQPDHLHTRDLLAGGRAAGRENVHAFVHILNLREGWAFCLDLPAPFGHGPAAAHTLALAPDGRRLFIADWTSGSLAVADTETLDVKRRIEFGGAGAIAGSAAAHVAPDGKLLYLAGGPSVLAIDSFALSITQTWPVGAATRGLAVSPDGSRLYIGQEGRVLQLDAASGREVRRLTATGLTSLLHATGRNE